MGREKVVSILFVILGILIIVGSCYMIASYSSNVLGSVVDFITSTGYSKLSSCGVTPPAAFSQVKADLTTMILPFLYAGLPLLFLVTSFVMFMGGFYYNQARALDESEKRNQIKREVVSRISSRTEPRKPVVPSQNQKSSPVVKEKVSEPETSEDESEDDA